ncbi:MAG: xylulokinase [Candidatus Humimicrobiaceae bacterium]
MKERYVAGIDIGTTGSKAGIFDLKGNMISGGYREYSCSYPKPNWIEQDPSFLVSQAMEASKEAIKKSGVNPSNIVSLGFSTQRSCANFLDKNGNLLRPMISWQDSRCHEEIHDILLKISAEEFYDITGFPINTTWVLPKILWVRKNEPKIWEKTSKVIQLQDFTLKAFGAQNYIVDVSDAGFYGLWDTNKFEWSSKILDLLGIDKNLLPDPMPSGAKAGVISKYVSEKSGFAEGTPICVGAGDQNSAAVGAGIVYNGFASVSMGTAGNANAYLDSSFRDPSGKSMIVNHAIYGKWEIEGHQAGAAGVFRWFRDEIGTLEKFQAEKNNNNVYKLLDELIAETPPGARGLVFLPYLASATAPRWNPNARGILAGLAFSHDRGCLARTFLEGITLEMKDILTSMIDSGVKISHVRLTGGASKSLIWNQIQSDTYNMVVETLKVTDTAVVGAAIMGGVGVGVFRDIRDGVEQMVKVDQKFEPNSKNAQIYSELYGIYCSIYEGLEEKKVFTRLSSFQSKY